MDVVVRRTGLELGDQFKADSRKVKFVIKGPLPNDSEFAKFTDFQVEHHYLRVSRLCIWIFPRSVWIICHNFYICSVRRQCAGFNPVCASAAATAVGPTLAPWESRRRWVRWWRSRPSSRGRTTRRCWTTPTTGTGPSTRPGGASSTTTSSTSWTSTSKEISLISFYKTESLPVRFFLSNMCFSMRFCS